MLLTSNLFFLFVALWLLIYYLVPKRFQWVVLLLSSYSYYLLVNIKATIFLVFSTVVTFLCALACEQIRESGVDSKIIKNRMKKVLLLGIILDVGMLAVLKYTNFVIENINALTGGSISLFHFLLPLGISYYTFQTIGYLLDVYWGKEKAEKNVFRYALFVSFFPQLTQGPINRYGKMAKQLYAEHTFELRVIKNGIIRILWGLFKKMVIAEWASVYRIAIFSNPDQYAGITIFGVILYSIELYGDFSGGIDVVIGVAEMYGIHMDENFKRPFFSISIADFWRRWHITLGAWMKDYIFYPLTLSSGMKKIQKGTKKILGKKKSRFLTVAISNIVIFLIVGIWHGASWNNIGWGLYNGILISVGGFFVDEFTGLKKKLHINDKSKGYHLFMILRTFALVNIGQYFDCVGSWKEALHIIKLSLTNFQPSQFLMISAGNLGSSYTPYALFTVAICGAVWFIVSVLQEKGVKIRETLGKRSIWLQFGYCMLLLLVIGLFSPMSAARGFIYAQF